MKKVFLFFAALAVILTSCGDGNSVKIAPSTTEISGPFGAAYTVVDKEYELIKAGSEMLPQYEMVIDLQRTNGAFPEGITPENCSDGTGSLNSYNPHFKAVLYDADNKVISEASLAYGQVKSLVNLSEGEVFPGKFIINAFSTDGNLPLKDIKSFKVVSEETSNYKGQAAEEKAAEESFGPENITLPSQLKGKVEVISASKKIEKPAYAKESLPCISIKFKLLETVNTKGLTTAGFMWINGIAKNAEGDVVKSLEPSINAKKWGTIDAGHEFKEFLESEPGTTITMNFYGDPTNSENLKEDLASVAQFQLSLSK